MVNNLYNKLKDVDKMEILVRNESGYFPVIKAKNNTVIKVYNPIQVSYFTGDSQAFNYTSFEKRKKDCWKGSFEWTEGDYTFTLEDTWLVYQDRITITRQFRGQSSGMSQEKQGIQLHLAMEQSTKSNEEWRFFSPATLYTEAEKVGQKNIQRVYMDDRLAYPLTLAYKPASKTYVTVKRLTTPNNTEQPVRIGKENRFMQKTEVGSIGHSVKETGIGYHMYWPYYEGDKSAALDSKYTPVYAYYPLKESNFDFNFSYEIKVGNAEDFSSAVFSEYKDAAITNPPEPVNLPFTLEDSIEYREESLMRTYSDLNDRKSGFFFHFDPITGYNTKPSGFSSSFDTIPHNSYLSIFEYGFTGRQLNNAYELGKRHGTPWLEKGKKVIDFFIENCCLPSGWMYSLYDLNKDEPFYSFGQDDAPKIHYISSGDIKGNYLRTMVEPALDILLNYRLHESKGRNEESWLEACKRFGDFLVKHQNEDGSWYRAYEPNGLPLKRGSGFGDDEFSAKSATAIPIIYLINLWHETKDENFLITAKKAGDYILKEYVDKDSYRGGTLDNPNVVDKEASQYAMAALLTLYKVTEEKEYLYGSKRAANIFITWNYIWNAPNMPDTILSEVNFKTVGLGGINSIWGGGVVDIYSLFHVKELYELGKLVNEPMFCQMSEWIAIGTQQLLSYPDNLMGFTDIGMQPEGFGVCNQGLDEQMITKGDIWGTLGWIYAAGIFGLGRYLDAKNANNEQENN